MTIDPTSYEPVYRQLARLLKERIDAGEYGPGERLPSEGRLAQMYGLGRNSVRDALKELKSQGIIRTVTGSGSYVRGGQEATMVEVTRGAVIATRMPTEEERRALGIDSGVPVFVVDRGGKLELLPGDTTKLSVG
ncbi:GntR family transcriptional regulator [Streptosporangium sandarakinum]